MTAELYIHPIRLVTTKELEGDALERDDVADLEWWEAIERIEDEFSFGRALVLGLAAGLAAWVGIGILFGAAWRRFNRDHQYGSTP